MINKSIILILLTLLVLFESIPLISAQPTESGLPYIFDSVVPKKSNLEIRGSAQVDLFTGAATFSYPISVPKGTNDLQPQLNIFYSSQNSDKSGILGMGWAISQNYIQRDINYSAHNTSDDKFRLILDGNSYDLIYSQADERFHAKIENFFYIKNLTGGENEKQQYWIVRKKDGTAYRFGFYNFSEAVANSYDFIWRWNLDLINDTYGNSIFYNYSENPYPNDIGAVYLDKIIYNNDGQREINLVYESTGRPDLLVLFDNGNRISQTRRLKEIIINTNNNLVRRYTLDYHSIEKNNETISSLANITEYGDDNATSLPSIKFEYYKLQKDFNNLTMNYTHCTHEDKILCFSFSNGGDYGTRLADVNNDGLVDIIKAQSTGGGSDGTQARSSVWINNGSSWHNNTWNYPECYNSNRALCFVTDTGADMSTRLVDVNSDGLMDIIKAQDVGGIDGTSDVWINNGTGWNNNSWYYPECTRGNRYLCFASPAGADYGTNLIDVNGDGLIDIIKAQSTGGGAPDWARSDIWINNGTGWNNNTIWSYPGCNTTHKPLCFVTYTGADYGVRMVDVNGDNLIDIVKGVSYGADYASSDVWVNNGTGWNNNSWYYPECTGQRQSLCVSYFYGVRFGDVNNDGLIDIIKSKHQSVNNGLSDVWINNGTGWNNQTGQKYPNCDSQDQTLCFVTSNGGDYAIRIADFNGDGVADFVRATDTGDIHVAARSTVWSNNASRPYLLQNITTQFGGIISIDYQKSTSLNNLGSDSLADIGFNIWVVSNITYENGINGIQNVNYTSSYNYSGGMYDHLDKEFRGFNFAEEKTSNKITKNYFHQDDVKKGREFRTEILDNQNNPYKTTERFWTNTTQNNYIIIELNQDSEITYDGTASNPKIKNTTYGYDSFGNVNYVHSKGDIADASDDKFEYYSYLNNSNLWIVDKVKNYSLFSSDNATKLREALYSYDALAYGSVPVKGDITRKEDYLQGGNNPITLFSYNNFGNIVNQTDANNKTTKYTYGIRDTTNTFPDKIINAKNQETNYYYDFGSGNLLGEIDSNNLVKNYTYDELSIEKTSILPLDTFIYPTQEYSHDFKTVEEGKIIVKQREQSGQSGTLDSYKFYDGFGRQIQSRTEAPNSKQIVADTYYDELGRVKETSNPYFANFSENYTSANSNVNKTIYTYDQLDRIVKITNPDGTFKNISYNKWNITMYDENAHRKDYQTDAHGRIILVIEYNNGNLYRTRYTYDSVNNLLSIKDALNNSINYTYDTLGRKTRMIDPDLGTWNYAYDAVGNLLTQKDNRGENLTFQYDDLNRKVKDITRLRNITYAYDVSTNNTLSGIQSTNFTFNYTYDTRLRKASEQRKFGDVSSSTQFTYDSSDRVLSQTLPNGQIINISYDEQGLISSINNILTTVKYDEKSSPTGIIYNNALSTNYTYYSDNLRLKQIRTSNKQNLNYTYDSAGNVKEINDSVHNRNFLMNYDDLNRLIYTKITDTNTILNFAYNEIGNMLNITGSQNAEFTYNSGKAHAPSRVVYY